MLPEFRYHPDPIATGTVKPSEKTCRSCDQSRGYIYTASVYAEEDLDEQICPWCIADGSAAAKFDATFSDADPLAGAGIDSSIIEQVTKRTPGYVSWQQEEWLTCCKDACAFHGDADGEELEELSGKPLKKLLSAIEWTKEDWD